MDLITRIFGAISPRFLARSYLLGVAFFAMTTWLSLQADPNIGHGVPKLLLAMVSTALFPFAKLVWNATRDFLMGSNIVVMNALILFPAKFAVNLLLWLFAPIVAPIGIIFLARRVGFRSPATTGQ